MDVVDLLQRQLDALLSAPVPTILSAAAVAVGAWWLKGTVDKGQIEGLQQKNAALDERVRLAADKAQPTVERAVETDEKGNVKPPTKPSELDTSTEEQISDHDEFSWFIDMQYAYLEEGDCLSKAVECYDKLTTSTHSFVHAQQVDIPIQVAQVL